MKKIIFIFLMLYLNANGQMRITFQDHVVKNNGDIVVDVFAQNLGSGIKLNSICANSMFSRGHYQFHFYLTYIDLLNNNKTIKKLPSSILIKTIFGSVIAMEDPHYYFSSTGSSRGQEWEINFTDIPNDAANVSIVVLGKHLNLGDMEGASFTKSWKKNELSNAISISLEATKTEEWEKALNWWDEAIKLDSETSKKYSKEISLALCEKAKLLFEQNSYKEAINLFEKAKETNIIEFNNYDYVYSNSLFSYGNNLITNNELVKGVDYLKKSYLLSYNNREEIVSSLSDMKRNWFLSTSFSVIPGLSQIVYQNGNTKPTILFTAFSLSSLLGVANRISADNYYKDYNNALTPEDATNNYNLSEERLKTSQIYFGIAIATIIYSVIDQYIDTSNYNSLFEINNSYSTTLQTTNNFSVSLNIPL